LAVVRGWCDVAGAGLRASAAADGVSKLVANESTALVMLRGARVV